MDSKQTLWISFSINPNNVYVTTVWNYDPKTDLYRWVAGPGNFTVPRNPGVLGVPSPDNAPGPVYYTISTIDHNDNLWFFTTTYCCELWMFNTTSYLFTRMQGPTGVSPAAGTLEAACFVTDSLNNFWLLSGVMISPAESTNRVWHFNTTSLQWTFISGNTSFVQTVYADSLYGGRQGPGCDIDENDRVWLFGGSEASAGSSPVVFFMYSDVWSFDTRTTQWQLERGSDATTKNNAQTVVSEDFHPDNNPSARETASFVDRKDGTLIMACGQGGLNDVWLFNKTSMEWKQIYGDSNLLGNFTHYRTPGSAMPARYFHGTAKGRSLNGDLFMLGGIGNGVRNDLWLIPSDHCFNNATYNCDSNAHCVNEMLGYSCACNDGFTGDGYTCTAVIPPEEAPPVSPEPVQAPVEAPQEPPASPEPVQSPVEAPQEPPVSPEPVQSPVKAPKSRSSVSSGSLVVVSSLVLSAIIFVL